MTTLLADEYIPSQKEKLKKLMANPSDKQDDGDDTKLNTSPNKTQNTCAFITIGLVCASVVILVYMLISDETVDNETQFKDVVKIKTPTDSMSLKIDLFLISSLR